jgi:CMP-N,N'-diacetyllegionaminic acid synthase
MKPFFNLLESLMEVLAIIPARSGSKGVPGKNIRELGGYPLLAYSVAAAVLSSRITRVLVSTDDAQIAEIGKKFGAEAPFLRPLEFSLDRSSDLEWVEHALLWLREHEGRLPEYMVNLRPTTPLRDPEIMDRAIEDFEGRPDATSLRSAHEAAESPFKWFSRDPEGIFGPLVPGENYSEIPRQLCPKAYIPDGYVDVIRPERVMETKNLYGKRILGFESPRCVEVDEPEDFDLLSWQVEKRGSVLRDFLKSF